MTHYIEHDLGEGGFCWAIVGWDWKVFMRWLEVWS